MRSWWGSDADVPQRYARHVAQQDSPGELATGRRAIGWYAFAALLIECDSVVIRIFDVFWFGELVRELVKRSLEFFPLVGFCARDITVGLRPPGKHHLFNVGVG